MHQTKSNSVIKEESSEPKASRNNEDPKVLDYDVVIIGGGPSGSMTGISLQKKGFKSCIIDKSKFPREKLCGGLLTQKTIDFLTTNCPAINPDDFIVEKTNKVDFYTGNNKVTTLETKTEYYFTERKTFDYLLIQEYKRLGGEVFEHVRVKSDSIDLKNNVIRTANNIFKFKFVVGADGCNSVLTKKVGIKRDDYLAVEGECDRNPAHEKDFRIYLGVAKKGYGWYFPKKDYYSVGIGGDNSKGNILKQANAFFSEFGFDTVRNQKGAFIPSGKQFDFSKLHKNTIVVGDAAGFIDPITGEGLYFALLSGLFAANAIKSASVNSTKNAKRYYLSEVRSLRKNISSAFSLHKLFHYPAILRWFVRILEARKSFALFYLEKVMSTYDFDYRRLIRKYYKNRKKWKETLKNERNIVD
jgi:menaquinone-9 beta-reductase